MQSQVARESVQENRRVKISRDGQPEPFFFAGANTQLFGCYHAPAAGRRRPCGVLLCYPLGHEYIRAHRNYRQLALRLANAHFPVLKFDLSGCGDSGGLFKNSRTGQWVADLSCAVSELRSRSGVERVCLLGLRMGGSLSMMAGVERGDIDSLILWDPIINGHAYVDHLADSYQAWLRYTKAKPDPKENRDGIKEIMGFPFSESLLDDFTQLNLLSVEMVPARNVLVVESSEKPGEGRALDSHLRQLGCASGYRHLPGPEVWMEIANKGLVAHKVMQGVLSWISEEYE